MRSRPFAFCLKNRIFAATNSFKFYRNMRRIFTTFLLCCVAVTMVFAQAPEKFTYQAVVRNANNTLVANASVGVRVSILQGSANGSAVYVETQTATTNANGLMTLNIGGGSVQQGTFANIDWANGPFFLKTETDPNGGSNYTVTSAQQLLSVPYALYAKTAENGFSGDYNDLTNTPTIPTNVGAFTNDVHYITEAQLNASLGAMNNTIDSLRDRMEYIAMHLMEYMAMHLVQPQTDSTIVAQACPGLATVIDYDLNIYNTVQIGNQCWMRENLRTTHYADGTAIALGTTASDTIAYYYPLQEDVTYGYLYNWKAVMHNSSSSQSNPSGVQGICPNGWHVPSNAEWDELENYVSSQNDYLCDGTNHSNYIAKALAATTGWNSSSYSCAVGNTSANNNATGFSALPAGRLTGSSYEDSGEFAYLWSSTETGNSNLEIHTRYIGYFHPFMVNQPYSRSYGLSVRCLRD